MQIHNHSPPWFFSTPVVTRKLSIYLFCEVIRILEHQLARRLLCKLKNIIYYKRGLTYPL